VSQELWGGYRFGTGPIATTIITSRGCPFNCAFCANISQAPRYRSPKNVIEEIKYLIDNYNCKHYRFIDDHLTQNKKRLEELCYLLEPLNINFRCTVRSDSIDNKTLENLRRGGCKELGIGVESADNVVLKLVNKKETVEDHIRAIKLIKAHGIKSKVAILCGLPGETWKSIELTKEFFKTTQPDKWTINLFTPFPGNDIRNCPEKYGVKILKKDWSKYIQTYPTQSVIETNVASNKELREHFTHLTKYLESNKWRK
jgi:radical SAM superfamily enzyme YgiQ (UPF0313 family)